MSSQLIQVLNMDQRVKHVDVGAIESETTTTVDFGVDQSSSMRPHSVAMQAGLGILKNSLQGAKECDEMVVSMTFFGSSIETTGYQLVEDMCTDYSAGGRTLLFDTIVFIQKNVCAYREQLKKQGIQGQSVVAFMTDGNDYGSRSRKNDAKKAIQLMQNKEMVVIFIAASDDAKGIGADLGVFDDKIIEVSKLDESSIRKIMEFVSKSARTASQNLQKGMSNGTSSAAISRGIFGV